MTGRTWFSTEHTEYINIQPFVKTFNVKNYPITSVSSIHNDSERDYGATSLLSSDDYAVDLANGIVFYDYTLDYGPQAIKIVYTAGYTAATIPSFIKQVLVRQVAHWWKQADNMTWHISEYDQGSAVERFKTEMNMLPEFVKLAERNSRTSYA